MAVAGLLLAPRSAIIIQVGLRLEKKGGFGHSMKDISHLLNSKGHIIYLL